MLMAMRKRKCGARSLKTGWDWDSCLLVATTTPSISRWVNPAGQRKGGALQVGLGQLSVGGHHHPLHQQVVNPAGQGQGGHAVGLAIAKEIVKC